MPHLIDPIPTLPTSSHVRAVNYSPHSKEPSSMMLEYASGLQINPTTENAYYTSTFNAGGPSSHGHSQGHPPRPAPSSLLHSLDYPLAPHLPISAHHETKPRSVYKVAEPTGRRKSETSTSQARRNSSSNNPYPRSRKEAAASHSMKSTSARNYDTLSVLSNDLGPIGPTNHILVPQDTVFGEPTSYNRYQEHLFQPISFRAQGFHELGVKLTQILKQRSDPIDGGDDHVFENSGYREIKVKIQWPGYPHHPFEKRVKTHNCAITRATVCLILANMVLDFVMMLKDRKVQVEKGYEGWAIGKGGFKANEFWITGLLHRGGNHFQPEIWVPQ
ncbi:hypothetical protein BDZ89DRAFT_428913 [Hymenopellis radicata]|nr:hypothetical protein BDZ89DRAFT_428913 [Hymenopellis radicata]